MRTIILALISSSALLFPANAEGALTVYTYESFTAEWGPGPKIEAAFEKQCGCDLKFVSLADGVALLNRLKLEGENSSAEVVLGLDTNLTSEAAATGLFAPHGIAAPKLDAALGDWKDANFLPYDFGYFAVIYDSEKVKTPPASLKELVEGSADEKIVIQDPRTSTPGLGLVLWMKSVYGDQAADAWKKLAPRILTVTPGWSEAYGLFTKGEAEMVLSYTTSPAYHAIAESSTRYKAAAFSEGHYMQVEVAGQTKKGAANPLAKQFLTFMLTPEFQDVIPENNWMLPAAATSKPFNPVFAGLVQPAKVWLKSPEEVAQNRKAWIAEWLAALGK
jgi:thiamine transport system substrate-binding protein